MQIKFFKWQLVFEKIAPKLPPQTLEDDFVDQAEALTNTWKALRKAGSKCRPWIDWQTKEVYITEPVFENRKQGKEKENV